jgi:DNA-binding SARP family transcriptional activator
MRFVTLGSFDLRASDGSRVEAVLGQPKRAALLAYLAAGEPGRTHLRDTLHGVFWPDLGENRARHALSQSLYALRQVLGPEAIQLRRGGHLAVDAERLWCDATEFRRAATEKRYADAVELYHGDLLPGFYLSGAPEFERWVEIERDLFRRLAADCAWKAAALAEEAGMLEMAVSWAKRGAEFAPSDEIALRCLLRLFQRAGDGAAAARAYEGFAARLKAEFGLRPSQQTERVMDSIRSSANSRSDLVVAQQQRHPAAGTEELMAGPNIAAAPLSVSAPELVADGRSATPLGRPRLRLKRSTRLFRTLVPALAAAVVVILAAGRVSRRPAGAASRARDLSQLGRIFWEKRTPSALAVAVRYFEQAIAADSTYAPAFSGLADSYVLLAWYARESPSVIAPRATNAALRAVHLDPKLPEAHTSLAAVLAWIDNDASGADAEFRRSLALNPDYATAHQWYALHLASRGRLDEALAEVTAAHQLEPASASISTDLASVLFWSGRYESAIREIESMLVLDHTFARAHGRLWRFFAAAGRYGEAVTELEQLSREQGVSATALGDLRRAYEHDGWDGALRWRMRIVASDPHAAAARPVEMAVLDASLGREDQALKWLSKARDGRNENLRFARIDPAFVRIRSQPQFLAVTSQADAPTVLP